MYSVGAELGEYDPRQTFDDGGLPALNALGALSPDRTKLLTHCTDSDSPEQEAPEYACVRDADTGDQLSRFRIGDRYPDSPNFTYLGWYDNEHVLADDPGGTYSSGRNLAMVVLDLDGDPVGKFLPADTERPTMALIPRTS